MTLQSELSDLCQITSIKADKRTRKTILSICSGRYLTLTEEMALVKKIQEKYGLEDASFIFSVTPVELCMDILEDILHRIQERWPMSAPFRDRMTLEAFPDKLVLFLPGDLEYVLDEKELSRFLGKFLRDRLGLDRNVVIHFDGVREKPCESLFQFKEKETPAVLSAKHPDMPERPKKVREKAEKGETPLFQLHDGMDRVTVRGWVIRSEIQEIKSGKILTTFDITDHTASISCKWFSSGDKLEKPGKPDALLSPGCCVRVHGRYQYDRYEKEYGIHVKKIEPAEMEIRTDMAPVKRCELHLHTKMSAMDAFLDPGELIKTLALWGHKAVAVTDHGTVQSFPEFYRHGKKHDIKILYGMEGYLVDDGTPLIENPGERPLNMGMSLCFEQDGKSILYRWNENRLTGPVGMDQTGNQEPNGVLCYGKVSRHPRTTGMFPLDMTYVDLEALWEGSSFPGTGSSPEEIALALKERFSLLSDRGFRTWKDLYVHRTRKALDEDRPRFHVILLAENQAGIRNLYRLVSDSHLHFFRNKPLIPKSLLQFHREGLLVGSACEAGEVYRGIREGKPEEVLETIARFYDYLEIQPLDHNLFLLREGLVGSREALQSHNQSIVLLGDKLGIPVVATCDAHFFEERDQVFREILMTGQNYVDAAVQAPLFFRTTCEMLAEFSYLGKEKAYEVVVENPNRIAERVGTVVPVPDQLHPPLLEGSDETLRQLCEQQMRRVYGDRIPVQIKERLEREMDAILSNRFSVMYVLARELVQKSREEGYLVGSRGSVGSSLAAYLAGITEINPMEAHYLCSECRFCEFSEGGIDCGIDLPDRSCPDCGYLLKKEGFQIPFETFMGFEGDKQPDIDLNFSGEYQTRAHRHVEELFGEENVFKAGTVSTIAEKTAYGFVKGYVEKKNLSVSAAEIRRMVQGIMGVRKTTGQHPGGMIVLPRGRSINEFTPVQRPADDQDSRMVTTHFEYYALQEALLKMDLLGHDDPTMLKILHETTGIDPTGVNIADSKVLSLFRSTDALNLEKVIPCDLGVLGIPEFGTRFVRGMLQDTRPSTISELIRISGLSHGTDVWRKNAENLIRKGIATLREVIATRDDIMTSLICAGMEKKSAFLIMEQVRKGLGLTAQQEKDMVACGMPEWYINSCKRIQYMFPKAHAAAYVLMALRITWYKVYRPREYYASYLSVRGDDFDYDRMGKPYEALIQIHGEMEKKVLELSSRERSILITLELIIEMKARGLDLLPILLERSHAQRFLPEEEGIRLPFSAFPGVGVTAANRISRQREEKSFSSLDEFKLRTGIPGPVVNHMVQEGILANLPETSQISFFS